MKKFIEQYLLGTTYPAIGIDKPENHDDIVDFIVNDVKETADPEEWHSGDVDIAFRRFLEGHQYKAEEEEETYYQPDFGDDDTLVTPDGTELWSYYVYSSKELAQEDFPDRKILEFSGDDIENPYFVK